MKANEIMKIRRQELGLTQKEVADRVGVTEATVSRWESGDIKNMRRDRIAALARVIDVPPAVLMDWEDYDAFIKKQSVEEYRRACRYFAEKPSMEASIYCSERADYLNRVIGLSWEEIEEIEISAYAA